MRFLNYLNEEFYRYVKGAPVYINPTGVEMEELKRDIADLYNRIHKDIMSPELLRVRFVVDNFDKKVYVFNANKLIHVDVINRANIKDLDDILCGEGKIQKDNKIKVEDVNYYDRVVVSLQHFFKEVDPWGTKYFTR